MVRQVADAELPDPAQTLELGTPKELQKNRVLSLVENDVSVNRIAEHLVGHCFSIELKGTFGNRLGCVHISGLGFIRFECLSLGARFR